MCQEIFNKHDCWNDYIIFFGLIDMAKLTFSNFSLGAYKEVFFKMDFSSATSITFWIAVFSLTLVLVFENLGLLHAHINVMLKEEINLKLLLKLVRYLLLLVDFWNESYSSYYRNCSWDNCRRKNWINIYFYRDFIFIIIIFTSNYKNHT